jgi:hypothetical protein
MSHWGSHPHIDTHISLSSHKGIGPTSWYQPHTHGHTSISVAMAWLDSASAWSPQLFQIGKTKLQLMVGLQLNHSLTSQNGYEELSYKYSKILIWASFNNTLDIQNTFEEQIQAHIKCRTSYNLRSSWCH